MSPTFERDARESRIKKLFYINYKIKLKFTELDIYLGCRKNNFQLAIKNQNIFLKLRSKITFTNTAPFVQIRE